MLAAGFSYPSNWSQGNKTLSAQMSGILNLECSQRVSVGVGLSGFLYPIHERAFVVGYIFSESIYTLNTTVFTVKHSSNIKKPSGILHHEDS